jgi:hypothetical protein
MSSSAFVEEGEREITLNHLTAICTLGSDRQALLRNKTALALDVLWPEARVTWGTDENSLQNMAQREPARTTLAAHRSATYRALPLPLLGMYWGDPASGRGGWSPMQSVSFLFEKANQSTSTPQQRAQQAVGHNIRILLPMEVQGERLNYLFRLDIKDAKTRRVLVNG